MTLEFDAVEFRYPGAIGPALSSASARIGPGEAVALVGANGSGKSTLMLVANGILRPSAGAVRLDGEPVAYTRSGLARLRSQVGVVFQDPGDQLFSASVSQDLSLGPMNLGLARDEVRRRVAEAAERCGLTGLLDRPTHALSGGEQALAALAGILAMRPRFLFADELTNSLDPWMRATVLDIFDGLVAEGCTVVLATHDLALARRWADRAILMERGAVRGSGPTPEILDGLRTPEPRSARQRHAQPGRAPGAAADRGIVGARPAARRAVLVVSFGTTHPDTLARTIAATERDLAAALPDRELRRAFTSHIVIRRLLQRDGVETDTVTQAIARLAAEGVADVLVQPLHILCGTEFHRLLAEIAPHRAAFERLAVGLPLLADSADLHAVADAIAEAAGPLADDEAMLLMSHGTDHPSGTVYDAFATALRTAGIDRVLLASVEGTPRLDTAIARLSELGVRRVTLMPFMLVAGEHASVDMAGEGDASWRAGLERLGYEVTVRMTGLGELPPIRERYVGHARAALAAAQATEDAA